MEDLANTNVQCLTLAQMGIKRNAQKSPPQFIQVYERKSDQHSWLP